MKQHASTGKSSDNVVVRLERRMSQAMADGFDVRLEPLGDGQSGWCQIGSQRLLFLDSLQTARDQLDQLNEALESFLMETPERKTLKSLSRAA